MVVIRQRPVVTEDALPRAAFCLRTVEPVSCLRVSPLTVFPYLPNLSLLADSPPLRSTVLYVTTCHQEVVIPAVQSPLLQT